MRRMCVVAGLSAVLFVSEAVMAQRGGRGTPIPAGEPCPLGTTEIRPRSCMAPDAPAPSILDYRPHSTLVTPSHMVAVVIADGDVSRPRDVLGMPLQR